MAKITLGPVIGKVTDTTARILIEVDSDAQVTCDVTDVNPHSDVEHHFHVWGTIGVLFTDLPPLMIYMITGLILCITKNRLRWFAHCANGNRRLPASANC